MFNTTINPLREAYYNKYLHKDKSSIVKNSNFIPNDVPRPNIVPRMRNRSLQMLRFR